MVETEKQRKVINTGLNTEEDKWNAATQGNSMYVALNEDEPKTIVITDWSLDFVEKVFDGKPQQRWELRALCFEEDGVKVDKWFNTSSKRLMEKLKPILAKHKTTDRVTLQVVKVGESFATNYSVMEVKGQ
jgi:hypothetical protein